MSWRIIWGRLGGDADPKPLIEDFHEGAFRGYLHYLGLRHRLELAAESGKREAIIAAIRAETEFGGRMSDTKMIHTRALIGKACERRFRKFLAQLEGVNTKAWRKVGRKRSTMSNPIPAAQA